MYKKYLKRPMDIILSFCALIVLSPVMLIVGILVRMKLGSPVIFRQERPGMDEKIFKMYKFRSLSEARDESGELLSDSVRLTKFGKSLRSSSLDELPELWNILKGDMSVVGPRPLLVQYLPYYTKEERQRHYVRPGLSGLAQIKGRNAISWEEKFYWDIEYVKDMSFGGDIKIIWQTIIKVAKSEGINESEAITMDYFKGTKKGETINA